MTTRAALAPPVPARRAAPARAMERRPAAASAPVARLRQTAGNRALARFLDDETRRNYDAAAHTWQIAAERVAAFDGALDEYLRTSGAGVSAATMGQLRENAERKSVRAVSTLAGEAAEVLHWRIAAPSIVGPGAGAGVDLMTYQPGGGGAPGRLFDEVKTARSMTTLKAGIADACRNAPRQIFVHYFGAGYARPGDFRRGDNDFAIRPFQAPPTGAPSARVIVLLPEDGQDEFSVVVT